MQVHPLLFFSYFFSTKKTLFYMLFLLTDRLFIFVAD